MMIAIALLCGVLFGAGLTLSGMSNPARILDFLDVASIGSGAWDATLGVVFVSAVGVMMVGYWIKARTLVPVLTSRYHVPEHTDVTRRLVVGAGLFGIGWGLAGLCPGPTIAALTLTGVPGLPTTDAATFQSLCWFFASMLAGVWIGNQFGRTSATPDKT